MRDPEGGFQRDSSPPYPTYAPAWNPRLRTPPAWAVATSTIFGQDSLS